MEVVIIPCGRLSANMYIVFDPITSDAIVIDPISHTLLDKTLDSASLLLKGVFLTHGHFDHCEELTSVLDTYHVPSYIGAADSDFLPDPYKNASAYAGRPLTFSPCSHTLSDNELITCGSIVIRAHHTPGHTPGSLTYEIDRCLFTGDTLFHCGIGRCDLWGGNTNDMKTSLQKLSDFAQDLIVYPGHGPKTSLFHERQFNSYFALL